MNYVVFLKMVPDVVEELKIADSGLCLDDDWLRFKLSECDEHSLEEAVILKEKFGGNVFVVALDSPEVDDALFTALAKGADKAYKITGDFKDYRSPGIAGLLAGFLTDYLRLDAETLILSGSQSIDDLEGEIIYYLAEKLNLPVMGVITHVEISSGRIKVLKEFAGGIRGEFEIELPAVLGIQAAENPPRYIPIAKIRNIMKTATIEEVSLQSGKDGTGLSVQKLFEPEKSGRAEIIDGSLDEITDKLIEIFAEKGII